MQKKIFRKYGILTQIVLNLNITDAYTFTFYAKWSIILVKYNVEREFYI